MKKHRVDGSETVAPVVDEVAAGRGTVEPKDPGLARSPVVAAAVVVVVVVAVGIVVVESQSGKVLESQKDEGASRSRMGG